MNQEPRNARRRKDGRTATASLYAYSEAGAKLGKSARRIYADIRISLTKSAYIALDDLAKACRISISEAARRAIRLDQAQNEGNKTEASAIYLKARRQMRSRKKQPRRRCLTKIAKWAKKEPKEWRHQRMQLRLTAYELSSIAIENAEEKTKGKSLGGNSYSATLNRTISRARIYLRSIISEWKANRPMLELEALTAKPKKAKPSKTKKEAERREKEAGTRSDL